MTSESRTLIDPADLLGVECECTHCAVKHLIPLQSFDRGVPAECPNCHEKWIQGKDEAETISYFVRCLKEVDGLATRNAKQNQVMRIRFQISIVILLCAFWSGCTKKATPPPPQTLSHDFRVAGRKWISAIDRIPGKAEMNRHSSAESMWQYIWDKDHAAWEPAAEASAQRDNDADNATYELLANYATAAFLASCDAWHQVYKGSHDPRCADGLCNETYAACQKEVVQALESGERIPAPHCKIGSNGHLPGWTEPIQ